MWDSDTRRTMIQCGWDVRKRVAIRTEAGMLGLVFPDGRWEVVLPPEFVVLVEGKESHVAYAAMEANEVMWSMRPVREANPLLYDADLMGMAQELYQKRLRRMKGDES